MDDLRTAIEALPYGINNGVKVIRLDMVLDLLSSNPSPQAEGWRELLEVSSRQLERLMKTIPEGFQKTYTCGLIAGIRDYLIENPTDRRKSDEAGRLREEIVSFLQTWIDSCAPEQEEERMAWQLVIMEIRKRYPANHIVEQGGKA